MTYKVSFVDGSFWRFDSVEETLSFLNRYTLAQLSSMTVIEEN